MTAPSSAAPTRRLLAIEVVLVLALSLGLSGVYALLDLLQGLLVTPAPLAKQVASPAGPVNPHLWLDLSYRTVNLAAELAPVLLVAYLLIRSGESLATIGIDGSRPRQDAAWSVGLAVGVGAVGLGALVAAKHLGVNRALSVGGGPVWWNQLFLVLEAAGSAISEEVIVCGFLLHRFRQIDWTDGKALIVASLVRASYHLYQGWGGAADNLVLGLLFGRIYQRRGRVLPLVLAHFLIDAGAYIGYVNLKGHVSWLP